MEGGCIWLPYGEELVGFGSDLPSTTTCVRTRSIHTYWGSGEHGWIHGPFLARLAAGSKEDADGDRGTVISVTTVAVYFF